MQAAETKTSPTSSCIASPSESAVCCHRTPSSASALVSLPARSSRFFVMSASSLRSFCSRCAVASCCCSCSTLATTAASAPCFSCSASLASRRVASASRSLARLGSTTLATSWYTSIARAHMHRLLAALDCLATTSGVNCGSSEYFLSLRITASGMLSLSNSIRLRMKLESPSSFLAVSQSGFSCRRMHTASMVICTSGGGLANDLISTMSFLLRAESAVTAALSAGIALSRSRRASSAISLVAAAWLFTSASSASTTTLVFSASAWSRATCSSSTAVAALFSSSTGASLARSAFMPSTMPLVCLSFISPLSRRSRAVSISSRFSASSVTYRLIRSR
mmetsp:Transcript_42578/g.108999  ORF Transcript_42578/g.108999 Transcript_42578/m.108999 type:complete len:337 (-) Transcript_42578:210-1220(-)